MFICRLTEDELNMMGRPLRFMIAIAGMRPRARDVKLNKAVLSVGGRPCQPRDCNRLHGLAVALVLCAASQQAQPRE